MKERMNKMNEKNDTKNEKENELIKNWMWKRNEWTTHRVDAVQTKHLKKNNYKN